MGKLPHLAWHMGQEHDLRSASNIETSVLHSGKQNKKMTFLLFQKSLGL